VQNQNTNEDIEDLQRMLREPLSESDRSDIEDTIRKFKADGNANILNDAFIVGATCLSTAYSLLTREIVPAQSANPFLAAADSGEMISALRPKCRFQIVILDESSQITEPLSLLPLAHFGCERLLLVGDPQQLPPTVPNGARWLGHPIPGGDDTHYGLERTLFERLAKCGIQPIMLSTQYRVRSRMMTMVDEYFHI
jgi:hypothetical protein